VENSFVQGLSKQSESKDRQSNDLDFLKRLEQLENEELEQDNAEEESLPSPAKMAVVDNQKTAGSGWKKGFLSGGKPKSKPKEDASAAATRPVEDIRLKAKAVSFGTPPASADIREPVPTPQQKELTGSTVNVTPTPVQPPPNRLPTANKAFSGMIVEKGF
jgi:hypothetical protein